ncbi:lysozyme family protein [Faecalimonas umbilicata]|nr:lysozyme family protein [Faecalimonas umbilicata]
MAETQTSIDEAVGVGTTAASQLKAMKTSATLSGMLKGGTAGPLGAVIGVAIQNRHTLSKAAIVILAVLMIPVLFIVMLPGLVFGDLTENTGALNSSTLINENIQAANQAIVEVLEECHQDILSDINAAIARLSENDTASINDPYAYSISVNANQLISQFCASRDNHEDINVSELKRVIRANKDGLFTYDVSKETVTMEVTVGGGAEGEAGDEAEVQTKTVTFTRHTYTVKYAGDAYFADHVFHLTEEQKKIADAYAENLTAFFGSAASGVATANVSDEVLAYRAAVQRIAAKYGMSEYVELILAVMMQESGGRGTDVMQASEGAFNTKYPHTPGGITDPEYSIECGIQELKYALDKAGCTGPTDLDRIKLALQGYNYGSGYIDWAMQRDGGYTKENAIAYSDMMCARPNWHYSIYGDKEYVDHVLRYYIITSTSGTYPANGMQIPHYLQTDYGNIPYGGGSIASSGCGPTSFAMVASYLTGTTITPVDAVSWCGNSYYMPGVGTYWSYFAAAASHFGCGSVTQTSDPNAVLKALSEGRPVISSQRAGLFTSGGHFIVLRGVTASGKVLVNDPNDSASKNYINREFDMMSEIHATANAYWIFDKK